MKRCPKCGNTYTDDTLKFCLQDGTTLFGLDDRAPATEILEADDRATSRALSTSEEVAGRKVTEAPRAGNRRIILALIVVSAVLLAIIAGLSAWVWRGRDGTSDNAREGASIPSNLNQQQVGTMNGNQRTVTPSASPAGFPAPSPVPSATQFGFIKGDMTYPSDAIPDNMVACAENVETTETTCTKKRSGWQAGVNYSLRVPPGRYYVYAVLLEDVKSRAYYTDFIVCGMLERCKSHQRIVLEVKAGENLTGIKVGDWWANFKS